MQLRFGWPWRGANQRELTFAATGLGFDPPPATDYQ
jgi:hypothetical protein